jgi:pilus assembly protein Flp/PilA
MVKRFINSLNLTQFIKEESGQDSVEYAILIGIIAVGVVGSVATIATYVQGQFAALAAAL